MKQQFAYCVCNEVIRTWIEDFVDEDRGEVISIERYEYSDTKYLKCYQIPESKSKFDKHDIKNLCDLYTKTLYTHIRLDHVITSRKYNSLVDKLNNSPKDKLLKFKVL